MRKAPNDQHIAVRRCILTGERKDSRRLIRLALGPDGSIAPDVGVRAPGRGAWIGVTRDTIEKAQSKQALQSKLKAAFKTSDVMVADDLGQRVDDALQNALLQRLGLEAKAGMLITGAEKVETAARCGEVALLLHAADAAGNGRASLDQAWRVGCHQEGTSLAGAILPFDRDLLSQALGRNNCVHAALTDDGAARRVGQHLFRLKSFRGEDVENLAGRILGSAKPEEGEEQDAITVEAV